jgi:hypothetical protein
MKLGHRNPKSVRGGLLRVCREGTSRSIWIVEGLQELLADGRVDRVGIWLEPGELGWKTHRAPITFRGRTREQGSEFAPEEWTRLSPWGPFSRQQESYEPVEWSFDEKLKIPILGPLIGMRRAIWVPVMQKGLQGLVMVASRDLKLPLAIQAAEQIADTLAIGLELESVRNAREQDAGDRAIEKRVQSGWVTGTPAERVLQSIAESCKEMAGGRVRFALLGERIQRFVSRPSEAASREQLQLRGRSGDREWEHKLGVEPLANLWRRSMEGGEALGFDAAPLHSQVPLERIRYSRHETRIVHPLSKQKARRYPFWVTCWSA